jgi:hypothetical protein
MAETKKKPMLVDRECIKLAEHFLQDDTVYAWPKTYSTCVRELAEDIQRTVDSFFAGRK